MTEEVKIEEGNTDEITNTAEDLAAESGWKPEDQWEGDTNQWIDAKTFNMRGELMDRIKSQTSQLRGQDKKIERLEAGLGQLAEHNKKMDEIAYDKALNDLKDLKKDALEMSDYGQVTEIDDKISDLKINQSAAEEPQAQQTPSTNPEVAAWIAEHSWYETDIAMRYATDGLTRDIVQSYPELKNSPKLILEKVTKRLEEEFPHKFKKRRNTTQAVSEGGDAQTRSKSSKQKYTGRHLNEMQREFGKTFVESGVMKSLDEYATQLSEMGELDAQRGA